MIQCNYFKAGKIVIRITNASVEMGAHIAKFSHLGSIVYRTGKKLVWDGTKYTNDEEANKYLLPSYREPRKLPIV